jgi:hypothetical protein
VIASFMVGLHASYAHIYVLQFTLLEQSIIHTITWYQIAVPIRSASATFTSARRRSDRHHRR